MTEARDQRPAVFVGAATFDAIAAVSSYPQPDERVVAEAISYAGGGPAATAAVAAARLGVPAAFVGTVGDDAEGERILQGLSAEGVDVSGVAVVGGRPSGASVIVVDRSGGTRAICTRPVPGLQIDGAVTLIRSAAWVHVDHLGWEPVHRLLADLSPADRPQLSVDAGNPIPGFTLEGVDLYVPTVEALVRTYGEGELDRLLDAAQGNGARAVVATGGSNGVAGLSAEGERVDVPGEQVEVVSTLGAGDVFHGALVAALIHQLTFADALSYANVVAALSCRGLDGRSAIPDHPTALGRIRSSRAVTSTPDSLDLRSSS